MSERVFRKYKVFALCLFVCAFLAGGLLGWLNIRLEQSRSDTFMKTSEPAQETTVPKTTSAPTDPLSPEERLYWEYFEGSEEREYKSYTLQDLDGNGVPEMLIYQGDSLRQVAAIRDGAVVTVLEDNGIFLCENGIVGHFSEGSGGCTVWFYQVNGTEADTLVCLVWLFHENVWYTSSDYSGDWNTLTPISDADRIRILSQYPSVEDPASKPMLQRVYQIME